MLARAEGARGKAATQIPISLKPLRLSARAPPPHTPGFDPGEPQALHPRCTAP